MIGAALLALAAATSGAEPAARGDSDQVCVGGKTGAAGDSAAPFVRADVRAIADQVTCNCGCPHLQVSKCFCGTADSIREDFAARLDRGETAEQVIAAYVKENGLGILAVPPRHGFHWIIWIGPPVLLVGGAIGASLAARRWARRGQSGEIAGVALDSEAEARYREQLRRAVEET